MDPKGPQVNRNELSAVFSLHLFAVLVSRGRNVLKLDRIVSRVLDKGI